MLYVVGYAPTEQSEDEEKDLYYQQLDLAMQKTGSLVIVLGDFNARIGQKRSPLTGDFGLAKTTSDNGMRLLDFADAYELVVTNTLFQHKHIHTATWYPPSSCLQPSVKDLILVKHRMRSMVHDTRVKRGPDFESDHKLVVSKLVLKLLKPKVTKQANSLRRYVRGDPKALGEYRASITAKFLQDLVTLSKITRLNFTKQLWIQQKNVLLHQEGQRTVGFQSKL